tara:strand:+ start:366 stop:473 length:108 start_codon:yes stop_codon:yes gene_type:complete
MAIKVTLKETAFQVSTIHDQSPNNLGLTVYEPQMG